MYRYKTGFIFLILILSFQVKSQKWITIENDFDSISYKSSEILITKDSVYFSPTDTFLVLPKGEKYRLKENPYSKCENFYDSLQLKSYKNRMYRELYQMVVRSTPVQVHDTSNFDKGEISFVPFKGMKIRNIRLMKVDVLEGSIFDTTVVAHSFLGKTAKDLHMNTKDYVIFNNLSIKEGDLINPTQLADNARILRNSPYLEDARIHVEPIDFDTTQVDLVIITKDKVSVGVGIDYSGVTNFRLFLYDKNFLGIGHEMRHYLIYNSSETPQIGYACKYRVNNIMNSFVSARLDYEHSWDRDFKGISINKEFLTQQTKYAGGISLYRIADKRDYPKNDSSFIIPYETFNQDYWIGRAFPLGDKNGSNFNLALRFANANFINRPYVTPDSNSFFHDQSLFLTSLSVVNIKYYLSSLVYGFGVTEDIPYGIRFSITSGINKDQFDNEPYIGAKIALGKHFKYPGFLFFNGEFGSFYPEGKPSNRIMNFRLFNIGNLHKMNRYSYRNFVDINYQAGYNLTDPLSKAVINNKWTNMIQGLNKDKLKGDQKLSLNLENVLFTPWYFVGFKFALTTHLDLGWVSTDGLKLSGKTFFSSIGAGLRIKNESWVFETITLGVAYLFKAPEGSSKIGFILDGSDPRFFKEFNPGRPEVSRMDQSQALFLD